MLDWNKYTEIADKFQHKARYDDREDLRQDIIVRLAEVASNNGHKPFTEGAMVRVASLVTLEYWRKTKAVLTTTSLSEQIDDGEGNTIELYQTIADDQAIDLEAWVDARIWLRCCPRRLVKIAVKRYKGKLLTDREKHYLAYHREKQLKKREKLLPF